MALRRIRGENFRVFLNKAAVHSATSCTVGITGNTEDASHKDVDHNFSMEQITSKSWNINVDNVDADANALKMLLTRAKSNNPIDVGFDHTTGKMNRTPGAADFARKGMALLTDLSIQADNRTTITVSEQYTGTGPLVAAAEDDFIVDSTMQEGTLDKGQHLRLMLRKGSLNKVFALSTSLTFHVSAQTEDATTKDSTDTDGMWQEFEKTGCSYDVQIGALIGIGTDDANTLNDIINGINDEPISWVLAVVGGENNRIQYDTIASGMGKLTNVSPTGTNRQNATYTATLIGYGPYDVAE